MLKRYILVALMRWIIGSQSTPIRINGAMHRTITAGIGHLHKVEPAQTISPPRLEAPGAVIDLQQPRARKKDPAYPVYLCEPLVVLYLSSIFARRPEMIPEWVADATLTSCGPSSLGLVLEEALLVVLTRMFGGESRALSEVFHTDQPWGLRKVTLVSLKRRVDGEMQSCPVSWTSGSSDRLGYKANSPEDVLKFLNNPDGKCFLFPDNHMGPDLSCFLQDVETKELILLVLQSKLSETLKADIFLRALDSVNPRFFYTVKVSAKHVYASVHLPICIIEEERRPGAICPVEVQRSFEGCCGCLGSEARVCRL